MAKQPYARDFPLGKTMIGRAAGNRTRSICSQSRRTTGILRPEIKGIAPHDTGGDDRDAARRPFASL